MYVKTTQRFQRAKQKQRHIVKGERKKKRNRKQGEKKGGNQNKGKNWSEGVQPVSFIRK